MRRMKLLFVAPALSALLAIFPPSTAKAVPADAISRMAKEYVQSGRVPGIMVAISTPGEPVTFIAHGVSDRATGAPMSRANIQRIGSITKSFTVTRLLQLADAGLLSLDDPISKYVSNIHNGNATLRELADMTSGIFNYTEDTDFVLDFAFHRTKRWTDRQLVAVANRHKPYFPPGREWYYSNTNTILLGMVVERVTGNPLGDEITRHLIRPLGLTRTSYPTGVTLPPPFTHGYTVLDEDIGLQDVTELSPSALSGAGAMISTVDDLLVWGRALARGSLVSKESQLARLQMINAAQGTGPFYNRYGLALGRINGWLGHTGDLFGYQALVMHNLVSGQTVVIFVNASTPLHVPTVLFQRMTSLLPSALPASRVRINAERRLKTTRPRITVRGRAVSPAGILLVQRGPTRRPAKLTRGTQSWKFKLSLQPGRNVVFVRATDLLGRTSRAFRVVIDRN